MATGFWARCKVREAAVWLALALAICLTVTSTAPAMAENNSVSLFLKKKNAAPAQGNWQNPANTGKAVTTTEIIADGKASPFLMPDSASQMQGALNRYLAIKAAGGWPTVGTGKYKKGSESKAVAVLNKRLYIEGYVRKEATEGEFAARFTSATEDAVKRFQRNHGLAVTGAVGDATAKELNVPVDKRIATIRANLPRLAEYSKDLGARYVTVNVPAMQIETVGGGRVYSRHNAIVGRPSRPTPVVMTALATIKFNPYWNAPASIIEKDIIPRMISGGPSKVLRDMNVTVFQGVGGPEVDPDTVDWRTAIADDYHFRQEPGGENAMATAKIEFSSPFGIYLHDTPERQLFNTGMRFLSSGCVRVDKVAILINWILGGQDGIDQARIAELAQSEERLDVALANPPQLRVAYLTAWPNRNGEVNFRPDIYELDGSGFVVGQPLAVGETNGGERFVLKPIARTAEAVDAAEATGFFNWGFGRKATTAESSDTVKPVLVNWSNGLQKQTAKPVKKIIVKKKTTDKKAKQAATAKAKTGKTAIQKTGDAKVAAKTATAASAKKTTAKTLTAEQCQPGKDGKLPPGCKLKTVVTPEIQAKAEETGTATH